MEVVGVRQEEYMSFVATPPQMLAVGSAPVKSCVG
jgi:hypothetical protein